MWQALDTVQSARHALIWNKGASLWEIRPLYGWTIAYGAAREPAASDRDGLQRDTSSSSAIQILKTISQNILHALDLIRDVNQMLVSCGLAETLRHRMIRHMVRYVLGYCNFVLSQSMLTCLSQSPRSSLICRNDQRDHITAQYLDKLREYQSFCEREMVAAIFGRRGGAASSRSLVRNPQTSIEGRANLKTGGLYELLAEYVYASLEIDQVIMVYDDDNSMEDRFGSSVDCTSVHNRVPEYVSPHVSQWSIRIPVYGFDGAQHSEGDEDGSNTFFDFAEAAERLPRPSREHLVLQLWDTAPYLH
jgi:hypothetical protein